MKPLNKIVASGFPLPPDSSRAALYYFDWRMEECDWRKIIPAQPHPGGCEFSTWYVALVFLFWPRPVTANSAENNCTQFGRVAISQQTTNKKQQRTNSNQKKQ